MRYPILALVSIGNWTDWILACIEGIDSTSQSK